LVRVQDVYIRNSMLSLEIKDGVQKGNQHFLLVLVAEDFSESDVVFYACEFHVVVFPTKIRKPLQSSTAFDPPLPASLKFDKAQFMDFQACPAGPRQAGRV